MDHKKKESQSMTSETFEQKMFRLEENYRSGHLIKISRASLVEMLETSYDNYQKAHSHDDKINALVWDGIIRALHLVLDMEQRP